MLGIAALVALLTGGEDEAAGVGRPAPWSGSEFYGANAPLLRDYATPGRAAALDAVARGMAAAGVRWARVVFDQSVEQRRPGPIDWTIPDRVVGALARHGIRTDALFTGTPAWVAGTAPLLVFHCGSRAAPEDAEGWSRFVGAAVERYGHGGDFWSENPGIAALPIESWEIGNEENLRIFWCPGADPEKYASIYSASRSAAIDADPKARVLVGGLAPTFGTAGTGDMTVPEFLRRMVESNPSLAREIPAVGIHPYGATPAFVLLRVKQFREAMRGAGLAGTPMLANEVGWYTSGPPGPRLASQAERAAWIRQVALAAPRTNCGLVGLGVNSWVTAQRDPGDPEDWYGLADPLSGVPNESGRAYAAAIAAAGRSPAGPAGGRLAHLCG